MKANPSIRSIVLIWFGWALVMIIFQSLVQMRISLERPDNVISWTSSETGKTRNFGKVFLSDPFLNGHVAWDSEYYLAIAVDGYKSTRIRAIPENFRSDQAHSYFCRTPGFRCYSLSSAFFPVYSIITRLFAYPLFLLNMTEIAAATLAALIVSLLSTLGAMVSLYFLFRKDLGEEGGVRGAFYFLIFPSSFFLAQVYSEGVFLGLIFASLAFANARKWIWVSVLSAIAVWARPGGAILALPFLIIWILDKTWQQGVKTAVLKMFAALSPVLSYALWSLTPMAKSFFIVESQFFGRGLLALEASKTVWSYAWQLFLNGAATTRFYYGLEFSAIMLTIVTCVFLLRKRPELGWFGLIFVLFAFTTGSAQGMVRYVLAAPPLFYITARWGRNQAFDRVWSLACILLLGLELTLFTFDFWVA